MITVILVDDHEIVRDGIRMLIEGMSEIEVIAEAGSADEMITLLKTVIPDLAIVDISLPDKSGIELTEILKDKFPAIKVLILSMYNSEDFIFNALKAGALGYLPKNTTKKELNKAIIEVNKGNEYFSESISNIILKSYVKKAKSETEVEEKDIKLLSNREQEVLKLFSEGKSNKEIAEIMYISIRTVESHKNHIMQKLELKTPVDLIKFAIKNGILSL